MLVHETMSLPWKSNPDLVVDKVLRRVKIGKVCAACVGLVVMLVVVVVVVMVAVLNLFADKRIEYRLQENSRTASN